MDGARAFQHQPWNRPSSYTAGSGLFSTGEQVLSPNEQSLSTEPNEPAWNDAGSPPNPFPSRCSIAALLVQVPGLLRIHPPNMKPGHPPPSSGTPGASSCFQSSGFIRVFGRAERQMRLSTPAAVLPSPAALRSPRAGEGRGFGSALKPQGIICAHNNNNNNNKDMEMPSHSCPGSSPGTEQMDKD